MKCILIAVIAIAAAASAGVYAPSVYSVGSPYAYSAPRVLPYAASYAAHYSAPHVTYAVVAPAIQSGYVAATRGSVHVAPLPEGPFAASHHINTAPAPGTF